MKIAVLSGASPRYKVMASLVRYNKVKYCNQYKYDYIEDSDYPDQGCGKYANKASQWYKIISILKHLDNYDYVLWSDVDTFIMNANFSLESYIDRYSEYHIICGGYEYEDDRMYNVPCLIHSGNFLIKNSIESKKILSTVFFNPKYYEWNNYGNHEESAITLYILNRDKYWNLIKIINIRYLSSWLPIPVINTSKVEQIDKFNAHHILKHAKEFKYLTDYPAFIMPINWRFYTRGDFILHISSPATYEERIRFMRVIADNMSDFI